MKKIVTTDRDEIREWIEERGGVPSVVRSPDNTSSGGSELRVDFGDFDEELDEIPWDMYFRIMEDNGLAFVYLQEPPAGGESKLYKFVPLDRAEMEEGDDLEDDPDMHHGDNDGEEDDTDYSDDTEGDDEGEQDGE